MQKTLTVNGNRYTANRIAKMFDPAKMTNGGDYIVNLSGSRYYANYRQVQEQIFAPTCSWSNANAIALMPDNGLFAWSIWLEYDPSQNQAAISLGSHTSPRKAATSAANGRKGGRPRKAA